MVKCFSATHIVRGGLFGFLIMCLGGCDPTNHQNGWIAPSGPIWEQIKPGVTTRTQAEALLGSPTLISTFDPNTWYYVSRQTRSYTSFTHPKLVTSTVRMLTFDAKGPLGSITVLDPKEIQDISPIKRETLTKGHDPSVFSQMFRNLGRFNAGGPKQ